MVFSTSCFLLLLYGLSAGCAPTCDYESVHTGGENRIVAKDIRRMVVGTSTGQSRESSSWSNVEDRSDTQLLHHCIILKKC
jgi:predicted FMN-binding regulatory protein PaiB